MTARHLIIACTACWAFVPFAASAGSLSNTVTVHGKPARGKHIPPTMTLEIPLAPRCPDSRRDAQGRAIAGGRCPAASTASPETDAGKETDGVTAKPPLLN
jgi:hypothetical protein